MANETHVPTPQPTTLEGWTKLLDSVRLPDPQASHDRVCQAIRNNRSSLRDIAELIQGSPALALSVIREANRQARSGMSEPAENLEVAITRLGLKRTEELLARLPTLPQLEIPPALRQLQLISQHASQQANGFFASRLARLWQDIHWGSLLFLSPLWPMALTSPQLLEEWERRVIHKGESARKVELQLFGVRLLEICQALVDLWRLPIWVEQGYRLLLNEQRELVKVLRIARDSDHPLRQQNRLDDDPTLRRWLNQPANMYCWPTAWRCRRRNPGPARTPSAGNTSPRCTCKNRWMRCSSNCTSKPPTAPGCMPCLTCGTRRCR